MIVYLIGILFVHLMMNVKERLSGKTHEIEILPVVEEDFKLITKSRFWFNWKKERKYDVFKLQIKGSEDILGLISLESFIDESRIEVRLLAVSKENRGRYKRYENVVGNLIAFACIQSVKIFGEWACVSLIPKTKLINHYIKNYSMLQAGRSLFLDGSELISLINTYDHD